MDDKQKELAVRLGAEFKRLRLERGMTQEDLADESGITTTYISLVELGKTNVTLAKAMQISQVLGVRLSEVLASVEE